MVVGRLHHIATGKDVITRQVIVVREVVPAWYTPIQEPAWAITSTSFGVALNAGESGSKEGEAHVGGHEFDAG